MRERNPYSFNRMIPGTFKSDLFRFCILYKYGGIYIDVKLIMHENYKLIDLLKYKNEFHVLDSTPYTADLKRLGHGGCIYTGLLIAKANDVFLKDLIYTIVKKCETFDLGKNPLDITGPNMYWRELQKYMKRENIDCNTLVHKGRSNIYFNSLLIIKCYKINEYNKTYGKNRYYLMYPNNIYKK